MYLILTFGKDAVFGCSYHSLILLGIYAVGLVTSYLQTRLMGGVGQRILFKLREKIFFKLQELPVAFFNANKTGDLISRINNDTDKLNRVFLSDTGTASCSLVTMFGAAIFIVVINYKLSLAALGQLLVVVILLLWFLLGLKGSNAESLKTTGGLSAEVAESINNFKVIVAFNRRDFSKSALRSRNEANYIAAVKAGIANNTLSPVFSFSANAAQLIVLAYGIYLINSGSFTLRTLVSFYHT